MSLATNGKECQLEVYKKNIDCLVLDLDTDNYPGLMVMKYMRLNHPSVKIILTLKNKKKLEELELNQKDLLKLGASVVLVKPFTDDTLLKSVRGEEYNSWQNLKLNAQTEEIEEKITLEKDELFTRVKLESVQTANITIFDHFIRLGPGRFIKVLRQGDSFDPGRIEKYIREKKIDYLYFKTKDRATYINYMNDLLQKSLRSNSKPASQIIKNIKSASEVYIEEIYTSGLKPQLIEEGKKICQSMYKLVQTDQTVFKYLKELQDLEDSAHGHLFLVSFLSTVISKNLEWASERTTEILSLAGLVHDIGKLKLPPGLQKLDDNIPKEKIHLFQQHPLFGLEMLSKSKLINEPVKQIVFQHHELVNGLGYPNALPATRIYPLAKIVSLADGFAHILTENKLTPLEGLKLFIPKKEETSKYDAMAIKALVKGLIR